MSVESELRAEALERDGYTCQWPSNLHSGPLEMAHLIQKSQGGANTLDGVIMLCRFHHDVLDNRVVKGRRAAILELLEGYLGRTYA